MTADFIHIGTHGKPPAESASSPVSRTPEAGTEHCMVCGEKLTYHLSGVEVVCSYCGKQESGYITCPNAHYLCEQCHNRDAMQVVEEMIWNFRTSDPSEIAERAMGFPGLPMLGCQHAFIAGGALMAALKNQGSHVLPENVVQEVFRRTAQQAHGGYCGLTGVCGIAPAVGACIAILTGSRCGKDQEQRTTMEAVTAVSRAITDLTGPSCCKAYVRTALQVAVDFLAGKLQIDLPFQADPGCRVGDRHPHGCRKRLCPYYSETADTHQV